MPFLDNMLILLVERKAILAARNRSAFSSSSSSSNRRGEVALATLYNNLLSTPLLSTLNSGWQWGTRLGHLKGVVTWWKRWALYVSFILLCPGGAGVQANIRWFHTESPTSLLYPVMLVRTHYTCPGYPWDRIALQTILHCRLASLLPMLEGPGTLHTICTL